MKQRKQEAVAVTPLREDRGLDQHGKVEVMKSGQTLDIF